MELDEGAREEVEDEVSRSKRDAKLGSLYLLGLTVGADNNMLSEIVLTTESS